MERTYLALTIQHFQETLIFGGSDPLVKSIIYYSFISKI